MISEADSSSAQRNALQTLQSDFDKLEQMSGEKRNYLRSCEQAIAKQKKEVMRLKINVQQAETMVDELQDALEEDSVEEGRLESLKQQLEDAREEKIGHEASYEDSVVAKDKNRESLENARNEMAKIDAQLKEAEAKVLKAEGKLTRCVNQRSSALTEMNAAYESVQAAKEELETYKEEREEKVRCVEDFTMKANEICPRVPVELGETYDSLIRKISKLKKDLSNAERRYACSGAFSSVTSLTIGQSGRQQGRPR